MGLLKIFLIIMLILALGLVGVGIYFYNFHVFYTARACVSSEIQDLRVPCSSRQECINILKEKGSEDFSALEDAPEPVKEKVNEMLNMAIYCGGTCKVKKVYGMGFGGVEKVEECKEGEDEILWEITGKEGLKILKFLRGTGRI
jgi:hypothetical protein